jgi:hypothetical protein
VIHQQLQLSGDVTVEVPAPPAPDREQCSLEPGRHVPAILDRPDPLVRTLPPRPRHELLVPSIRCPHGAQMRHDQQGLLSGIEAPPPRAQLRAPVA